MSPPTTPPHRGDVAIVTGGSGGVGLEVVRQLCRDGYAVLLAGRQRQRVDDATRAVAAPGFEVSGFAGDLAEDGAAEALVALCVERYGRLTAFVHAAAYEGQLGPLERHSIPDFDRMLAVNVRGAFLSLRAAVPALRAAGGGRLVTVASQAGLRGVAGCAAYAATKHALIGLSASLALELASAGIAVNVVAPGPTATEMIGRVERALQAAGGDVADIAAGIPDGRYGTPSEVAETIAWLVARAPAHLTGAVIPVDGALTTR